MLCTDDAITTENLGNSILYSFGPMQISSTGFYFSKNIVNLFFKSKCDENILCVKSR